MEGFIKLPRSLLNWEWYAEPNTLSVYITLLLMAEFRDCRYKGVELKPGQVAVTVDELSKKCGISVRQVRTALNRLKLTNKTTIKSTTKFSVITLLEYNCVFQKDKPNDNPMTNERQTNDNPTTNERQTNDNPTTNERQTNDKPTLLKEEIKNLRTQENPRADARGGGGAESSLEKIFEKPAVRESVEKTVGCKGDDALIKGERNAGETEEKNVGRAEQEERNAGETEEKTVEKTVGCKGDNALITEKRNVEETVEKLFEKFWEAYPKKTAKHSAFKEWKKIKPSERVVQIMLEKIEKFKQTEQWRKEDGRYIPYPANWLSGRRWEDEFIVLKSYSPSEKPAEKPRAPQSAYEPYTGSSPSSNSSFDLDAVMQKVIDRYRYGDDDDSWLKHS